MPAHHPTLTATRLQRLVPSVWDLIIFGLVIGGFALIAVLGRETLRPLAVTTEPITLDPWALPHYALRSSLRMMAGMAFSLVFTFVFGALAAKSRKAEMVVVPMLDIGQSVPVIGFLSFTTTGFMALFPGQVLGAELAAIFAIFTSQVWNMAFSFYQSCKTLPRDLVDLSYSLRLGSWRRFWTLEAPYATPALVWNAMISMSGAWFFVVASEAIMVGDTTVSLPGVGSYVALAIAKHDLAAVGWAVLTMLVVVLIFDQLLFRPLVAWAEKFRLEPAPPDSPEPTSWVLDLIQRAELARRVFRPIGGFFAAIASIRLGRPISIAPQITRVWESRYIDWFWYVLLAALSAFAFWRACVFIGADVSWNEVLWVVALGFFTLVRVMVLLVIASIIWLPIGVWIGLRPRWADRLQPVTQFLSAFPSNLLFPAVVVLIVRFHLTPDIWLSPLMMLGAQWYILFNVIAGARAYPGDLLEAAAAVRARGWTWWRKVILPWIMPSYITGAITAGGGAWNAAIVAEVANWGNTSLTAHGLGAYIATASTHGDLKRVALGVGIMVVYVVVLNRAVWEPVFSAVTRRLHVD